MHATCLIHLTLLDFLTRTVFGEAPHYAIFSSLLPFPAFLCPNILLSTLFSNTLNICSFLGVTEQVSCPWKTMDKT